MCGHVIKAWRLFNTVIIKPSALSTVVPDGRGLAIFAYIGDMLDNKEFAHSVPANDTF
jgi:hypothetical protein